MEINEQCWNTRYRHLLRATHSQPQLLLSNDLLKETRQQYQEENRSYFESRKNRQEKELWSLMSKTVKQEQSAINLHLTHQGVVKEETMLSVTSDYRAPTISARLTETEIEQRQLFIRSCDSGIQGTSKQTADRDATTLIRQPHSSRGFRFNFHRVTPPTLNFR